jgi:hypothetical protein
LGRLSEFFGQRIEIEGARIEACKFCGNKPKIIPA